MQPVYPQQFIYQNALNKGYGRRGVAVATTSNDLSDTMTYNDARWDQITEKKRLAEAFLDSSSRETLRAALEPLRAMESQVSVDHYLDKFVTDAQTIDDVAESLRTARDDPAGLEAVMDLDGIGWEVATELLHALAPDTYAILNTRSAAGMEALGYTPPPIDTASVDAYWDFVDDVENAVQEYPLRALLDGNSQIPDVPPGATRFEVAHAAFDAHFHDRPDFDLRGLKRDQIRTVDVPTKMYEEVAYVAARSPMYRDAQDFIYSAIRRELEKASE